MTSLLEKALTRQNLNDRRPVWLMRQAGRILKEYRKVRLSAGSFINLVKNPALAAEVTMQPVEILGVDAAIIFSDILVVPEAMGFPYQMIEKKGPFFEHTVEKKQDVDNIIPVEEQDLSYVYDAIKLTKVALPENIPLIGFAGAPWTIFSYLIEGQGSKTFSKARMMLEQQPELSHQLLQSITDATILYLMNQSKAGADVLQLFDSWAGVLDTSTYKTFGLDYNRQIFEALEGQNKPRILFPRGAYNSLKTLRDFPTEAIQLDWQTDVLEIADVLGEEKVLQGSLDPAVLYGNYKSIEQKTKKMLDLYPHHRHVVNLGHGLYPDINPEHVKCFIETVKSYSSN